MTPDEIESLDQKRVIVLDTETTGFDANGNDEILSLSIIDLEGTVLFDELVKPTHRQRWPKAQEVNGITPSMVKYKPSLLDHAEELSEIWQNTDLIVGYNTSFDMEFIRASGLELPSGIEEFDVMREYASAHNTGSWVKLVDCAEHYGIAGFDAHSSIADAEATRRCFLALLNDQAFKNKTIRRKATRLYDNASGSFYEQVSAPQVELEPTQEEPKKAGGVSKRRGSWVGVMLFTLLLVNAVLGLLCIIGGEPSIGFFFLAIALTILLFRFIEKKRNP